MVSIIRVVVIVVIVGCAGGRCQWRIQIIKPHKASGSVAGRAVSYSRRRTTSISNRLTQMANGKSQIQDEFSAETKATALSGVFLEKKNSHTTSCSPDAINATPLLLSCHSYASAATANTMLVGQRYSAGSSLVPSLVDYYKYRRSTTLCQHYYLPVALDYSSDFMLYSNSSFLNCHAHFQSTLLPTAGTAIIYCFYYFLSAH